MTTTIPELRLGDRLRITRERAGISRDEMAKLMGVSPSAISNYESGARQPRQALQLVTEWAEATGFNAHWIAFGDDSTSPRYSDFVLAGESEALFDLRKLPVAS